MPARLLARIADDMLGRRIRDHLTVNGVELDHAVRAREQTSMAMVAVDPDGGPSYDFRIAGTADWQWTPEELAGALDGPVVALHSGSLALTTPPGAAVLRELLARAARTATISYDPNCRPLLMGDPADVLAGAHELLAVADVVKVSSRGPRVARPRLAPRRLVLEDWLGRGPAIVAVTLGGDGVLAGTATGVRVAAARRAGPVVDTVGAGDTFSAALLAGLHRRGTCSGAAARPDLRAVDADDARRPARRGRARRRDHLFPARSRPAHRRRPAGPPALSAAPGPARRHPLRDVGHSRGTALRFR